MPGYPKMKNGAKIVFNWKKTILQFSCCDCYLVHNINFNVEGNKLWMQVSRNNRSTAALRRYHKEHK